MDQIPVKAHKSNYDDKTAQFNLEAVKIIKFSLSQLCWVLTGDWDARVVLSDIRCGDDPGCDIEALAVTLN